MIEASLDDPASLKAMTQQAKVVIATAGPFCKLGTPIVDAAIATGTHYVDITGGQGMGFGRGGSHHGPAACGTGCGAELGTQLVPGLLAGC